MSFIQAALLLAADAIMVALDRPAWLGLGLMAMVALAPSARPAETTTNIRFLVADTAVMVPVAILFAALCARASELAGLAGLLAPLAAPLPAWLQVAAALLLSDLAGYWRHRLLHCDAFWPAHAVHHSDTDMGWLTLIRVHPLERLVNAAFDTLVLSLAGFPPWVVVLNNLVRHYYGYFIHADLPIGYGPLRHVFVSPQMHRWHHAADPRAA